MSPLIVKNEGADVVAIDDAALRSFPPAIRAEVGRISIVVASSSQMESAGIVPGHHMIVGMRKPPFDVV